MTITINLPPNLDEAAARRAEHDAREAAAVSLYREGKMLHKEFAQFLGLDRWGADEVLRRHGVYNGPTAEDIAQEVEVSRRLRESSGHS